MERRFLSSIDWALVVATTLLCLSGLVLLYSAGYSADLKTSPPMNRQALSMAAGLAALLVGAILPPSFWRRWTWALYAAGCALLVLILVDGVVAGGARRWLAIGGFRFQPSEFMKVGLILALARVFSAESAPSEGYTLGSLYLPCLVMGLPVGLIVVEPDLGTALCLLLIGGSMLLVKGVRTKTLFRLFLAGLVLAIPAWNSLKDYQKQRVLTFLSPEEDPLGTGYHAIQSQIAVGSGSLTGKGFFQGTQTQLRFLPEQTTDFIFSVLAEEWGFLGSVSVIFLYAYLMYRLLVVSIKSSDQYSAFVCLGVAALVFWHVIINIGMVVGVLPVVGLTLPFLSFGGSSVVTVLAGIGLALGASRKRLSFEP